MINHWAMRHGSNMLEIPPGVVVLTHQTPEGLAQGGDARGLRPQPAPGGQQPVREAHGDVDGPQPELDHELVLVPEAVRGPRLGLGVRVVPDDFHVRRIDEVGELDQGHGRRIVNLQAEGCLSAKMRVDRREELEAATKTGLLASCAGEPLARQVKARDEERGAAGAGLVGLDVGLHGEAAVLPAGSAW
eukprot:CAMPEP_0168368338 /NCGR_PEP_ID=MMETSP0228-20121227/6200_1 /TAXON_ID=133427 /ORGANISM="Protoceratium reticulatum, Strain CCCM 535 (=CCMP 1889)" /LENGTH=188 /DNA_ID=CAMNT_0008381183 /DNA_START=8 /DNA_END=572 /DNA_ORIENTATION=+